MPKWLALAIGLSLALVSIPAHAQFNEETIREAFKRDIEEVPRRFRFVPLDPTATVLAGDPSCQLRLRAIEERLRELGCVNIRRQPFKVTRPVTQPRRRQLEEGAVAPGFICNPLWPNLVDSTNVLQVAQQYRQADQQMTQSPQARLPWVRVLTSADPFPSRMFAQGTAIGEVLDLSLTSTRFLLEPFLSDVPIRAPRVATMGHTPGSVEFRYQVRWKQVGTYNLIAELPGTDPKLADEPVLLGTYVDGFSIVLNTAAGGTAAGNVEAVLAIIAQLKERPAPRPVRVVFFSAHAFGLKGERIFVQSLLKEPSQRFRGGLMLDLADGSSTLGIFGQGCLFETRPESRDLIRKPAAVWRMWADALLPIVKVKDPRLLLYDGVNESDGQPWKATHVGPFACSSEPFLLANLPVVTIRTINDARPQVGTPLDGGFRQEHIATQAGVICALLRLPLHQPSRETFNGIPPFPLEPTAPRQATLVASFAELKGKTLRFDPQKSFLPNVPVPGALAVVQTRHKILTGVLGDLIEMTDEKGAFEFVGLPGVQSYWHTERKETRVSAFSLDGNGSVVAAATSSQQTGPPFPRSLALDRPVRTTTLTMFDAKVLVAPFVADPLNGLPIQNAKIVESETDAEPRNFDFFTVPPGRTVTSESANTMVVFHDAKRPVDLEVRGDGPEIRKVWRNAKPSPYTVLTETEAAKSATEDTQRLYDKFLPYRMLPEDAGDMQRMAMRLASTDSAHAGSPQLSNALGAQALVGKLRPLLEGQAREMVLGLFLYLALLIPCAYIAERFVFGFKFVVHRLIAAGGFFGLGYVALQATHPAFQVVRSPFIIFVSFSMAALSLWVMGVVFQRFDRSFRRLPEASQMTRGGAALAFGLAIENLRRRPLRTGLLIGQMAVAGYVLMSFTSLASVYVVHRQAVDAKPPGQAAQWIRNASGEPLSPEFALLHPNTLHERVIYPDPKRQLGKFHVLEGEIIHEARALLPLQENHPYESSIWVPRSWGVKAEWLLIHGRRFRVRGTLDDPQLPVKGQLALPPDFSPAAMGSNTRSSGWKNLPPMSKDQVAVVQFSTNGQWPSDVLSVVLHPSTANPTPEFSQNRFTDLPVLTSQPGATLWHQGQFAARPEGLAFAALPFLIAIWFVWSAVAASAHERRTEMATFAALGMSPRQLASLFLAEAVIVGVVGALLGYYLAQAAAKLAALVPGMQTLALNFGSGSAALATVAVLAMAVLGAAYPTWSAVRQSQRLAGSPDLEAIADNAYRHVFPAALGSGEADLFLSWLAEVWKSSIASTLHAEAVQLSPQNIEAKLSVAPFDLGVVYDAKIGFEPTADAQIVRPVLLLQVVSGDLGSGRRLAGRVADEVRRALLEWRLNQAQRSVLP